MNEPINIWDNPEERKMLQLPAEDKYAKTVMGVLLTRLGLMADPSKEVLLRAARVVGETNTGEGNLGQWVDAALKEWHSAKET